MDLTLFQFDYDLTFAAFFLNADKTIYGRFGSRSEQKEAEKEISLDGFRKALSAALELHKNYPANKASIIGKQPRSVQFRQPEEFPSLSGKYQSTISYTGKVAQSCMHCHQVREAERRWYRDQKKPLPDQVLYPWPMPNLIGLSLDPKEKASVREVTADSAAAKAGFKPRDDLAFLEGQSILSIADVQWILHHAPDSGALQAEVLRAGKRVPLTIELQNGWRLKNDISWRATSWDLRRMATGGLVLKDLSNEDRTRHNLPQNALALLVEYVGQYNEHAVGKRAGFQKNDIIVRVDSQADRMTESELFRYLLQNKAKDERASVTILRDNAKETLSLPLQ